MLISFTESLSDAYALRKYFEDAPATQQYPILYVIVETIEKKQKILSVVPQIWINVGLNIDVKSKENAKLMFPKMNFGQKQICNEIISMAIKDGRCIDSLGLKYKTWDCFILKAEIGINIRYIHF